MFQIYVTDLPSRVNDSDISMFVDDTAIFATVDSEDELELILQDDLHTIDTWFSNNRLSINVSKTKAILLGSQQRLNRCTDLNVLM